MFSIFKSARISPEWTFSAAGMIWRIVPGEQGCLVGECRDPERKVASFFCLDISTGRPLWKELRLDDQWWVGIEAVQKNTLLLHGFAQPDMPQHRAIRAFDVLSGLELWRNDDISYWFGFRDRVVAYRDFFERRVGYEFDLQSGILLKTHDNSLEELHRLRPRAAEEEILPDVVLPDIFAEEESDDVLTTLVRKETKGTERSGNVEFIRRDDVFMFNFHVQRRDRAGGLTLENNLIVYSVSNEKRVFADVIGQNLTGYVPDSFFVKHPFAFFIKDQKVLVALRLWKS